ncbi:hypothetical protein [Drosophila suzukii associated hytrosavirus 1]|nr:hypothetical protein [Drosophila suzukii associated hytrosavirus 1]
MGFWHYSPNGCCLFINDKTQTIQHLYIRESCSLTKEGLTVQKLLAQHRANHNSPADDEFDNNDESDDNTSIPDAIEVDKTHDDRFLRVLMQPYITNTMVMNNIDTHIVHNMKGESRSKLLTYYDEIMIQHWFIVCDMNISYDTSLRNVSENMVHHLVLKNVYGPLFFCSTPQTLVAFISMVTNRFIHQQMPVLNNMPQDRLYAKLMENINFVTQFPAHRMIQYQPSSFLSYMDARDLFDVVKLGHSGYITNMRSAHITNEANFLDTWRRILFNFVHELANIHNFETQMIRIRSTCSVIHFIKGNNRSVIPEFRCEYESRQKCIHLKTRRKEYEIYQNTNRIEVLPTTEKHTLALSDDGVICRHVLEVMVDEYGEEAVDKELNFNCYFNNAVYEHYSSSMWEHMVRETLGIDKRLKIKDGSSAPRERISCMQAMCNVKRMNDIHRFCLPKRFLTLAWFKWACNELKLNVFEED